MKILGVDPGIGCCGMTIVDENNNIVKSIGVEGAGLEYGKVLYNIKNTVVDLCKIHGVTDVACERPMFLGKFRSTSVRPLYMIEGATWLGSYESMVNFQSYTVSEWRKIVFGSARKEKSEDWKKKAVDICEFWSGVKLKHDCAEAYCIAFACMREYKEAMKDG